MIEEEKEIKSKGGKFLEAPVSGSKVGTPVKYLFASIIYIEMSQHLEEK